MEPVQPTPSVDTQPINSAPQPDAQASTGGRFSRVTGLASRALGLDQQAASPASAPSFEPTATTPGLQPRVDTTPASIIPSPWANPDAAVITPTAPVGSTESSLETASAFTPTTEPAITATPEPAAQASSTPEPVAIPTVPDFPAPAAVEPAIIPTPEFVATATPEPTIVSEPVATPEPIAPTTTEPIPVLASAASPVEPTPTISPVWTPSSEPSAVPIEASGTPTVAEKSESPVGAAEQELSNSKLSETDVAELRRIISLIDPRVLGPDVAAPAINTEPTPSETQTVTSPAELPPPLAPITSPTLPGTI